MANIIKGNQDGENGENETYSIPGRSSSIPRKTVVKEVKAGQHPNFGIYKREGVEYVRGKPDNTTKDNVNE
jgi:hypothetical protein